MGNAAVKCTEVAHRCRQIQMLVAGLSYPGLPALTGLSDLPNSKNVSIPQTMIMLHHRCLHVLLLCGNRLFGSLFCARGVEERMHVVELPQNMQCFRLLDLS